MRTALLRKTTIGSRGPDFHALTVSGNEITDASRRVGTAGDGLLNDDSYGVWPAATNLCTNGGFETNTTGWTTGGTNTIAASAEQAKFGAKSLKCTYADNAVLADYAATITNVAHTDGIWVYIPTAYDGGGIEMRQLNYTVAASAVNASMATRDVWQKLTLTFTPGADVAGDIQINNTGAAPTAGRFIYIDGNMLETGSVATPYIETNGGTASRTAARVQAPAMVLNATQGGIAMRWRSASANPAAGGATPRLFSWADSTSNEILAVVNASTTVQVTNGATGGVANQTFTYATTFGAGVSRTDIVKWTSGDMAGSANGAAFTAAGSRTELPVIAASTMDIGSHGTVVAARELTGDVHWVVFWDARSIPLSDADVARLHAIGNRNPSWQELPGNPSGFWSATTGVMEVRE